MRVLRVKRQHLDLLGTHAKDIVCECARVRERERERERGKPPEEKRSAALGVKDQSMARPGHAHIALRNRALPSFIFSPLLHTVLRFVFQ